MTRTDLKYLNDLEVWQTCPVEDLWVFDKLLLSKMLEYTCGPKGVSVPKSDTYIIRPCVNLLGMGRGAYFKELNKDTSEIEDGHFWCEVFSGRHLSFDYVDGEQILCVEGIKQQGDPIYRWREWKKTNDVFPLPDLLKPLVSRHKCMNLEVIGDKIIEVHFRLNSNWKDADYSSIIPFFEGDETPKGLEGYTYKSDPNFKRLGFFVKSMTRIDTPKR